MHFAIFIEYAMCPALFWVLGIRKVPSPWCIHSGGEDRKNKNMANELVFYIWKMTGTVDKGKQELKTGEQKCWYGGWGWVK